MDVKLGLSHYGKGIHCGCLRTAVRRIFGLKRDEVTGKWRKLHNEELYILYSSPNIIRQKKSKRIRWAGHVACMGDGRKFYFLWESPMERDLLEV
jgi:hypothetical protein